LNRALSKCRAGHLATAHNPTKYCALDEPSQAFLRATLEKFGLSARAYNHFQKRRR